VSRPTQKTHTGQISVSALGGLSIRSPVGEEITFPTKKCRGLLVYLAISRGKPRSREHLAGLLWSRSAEEQARASLRQTLAALRKASEVLDIPLLNVGTDNIALATEAVVADVLELEDCASQGTTEALQQIAELYQGDFLDGFSLRERSFDEWVSQERNRLQHLAVNGMQTLLAQQEQVGATIEGIQVAQKLLLIDPLQESTHRALMRLYRKAGHREQALQQYETCRALLHDELDVEPDVSTRALYQEVLASNATGTATVAAEISEPKKDADPGIKQAIRFCSTEDGKRISYATSGSGPPLVKTANWLSHLEFDWRSPVWRHWLEALSADHTLVRYDPGGCGLSDWDVDQISFDSWLRELEAVVAAARLDRFPLLGISQGGAIAIAYAVLYPERVTHLILYGAYARGKFKRDPSEQGKEELALAQLVKLGWGKDNPAFRQVFTTLFIPEGTAEQHKWFNDLQRVSMSPDNAAKFIQALGEIDVEELLPQVRVPTLVLHAENDARVSFNEGRLLASQIPDAIFVPLSGNNHILLEDEPAWPQFLAAVRDFLTGN